MLIYDDLHAIARVLMRRERGGGWERVSLSDAEVGGAATEVDVVVLSDALDRLAQVSERQASIVQVRWFGGMTNEEVADHLGLGHTTVKNEWTAARAWLRLEMRGR